MDFEAFKTNYGQLANRFLTPEQIVEVKTRLETALNVIEVGVGQVVENVDGIIDELNKYVPTEAGSKAGSEEPTLEQKFEYVYERLDENAKRYYLDNKHSLTTEFAWVVEAAYEFYQNEQSGPVV